MKVLMLSSDSKIFEEGSEVRQRMLEYAELLEELHVIVLSDKKFENKTIKSLFLYPTNSKNKLFAICDAIKIGKRLKKLDVVTSQDAFEIGFAGYKIAKYHKTKLQLQIHTDFLSPYFKKESFKNKIRVCIAKYLLPKADSIRVVSQKIKNSLIQSSIKNHQSKIFTLPIFVDVEKIKNSPIKTDLRKKYPQFEKIILMASRLTKEKNIPLAIEAMKEVVKKYPKAGLLIVGDGPEKEKLKAKRSTLNANIIFEDWTDDLASYYKTSDIFLLTSDYEGYGRTIIEALVAGTPVVSTDVGYAREAGAILTEHNASSISEKIVDFFKDQKKRSFEYEYKSKDEYLDKFRSQFSLGD